MARWFPSLRRRNPDQVQRVTARRLGPGRLVGLSAPCRGSPRRPPACGGRRRVSTAAVRRPAASQEQDLLSPISQLIWRNGNVSFRSQANVGRLEPPPGPVGAGPDHVMVAPGIRYDVEAVQAVPKFALRLDGLSKKVLGILAYAMKVTDELERPGAAESHVVRSRYSAGTGRGGASDHAEHRNGRKFCRRTHRRGRSGPICCRQPAAMGRATSSRHGRVCGFGPSCHRRPALNGVAVRRSGSGQHQHPARNGHSHF